MDGYFDHIFLRMPCLILEQKKSVRYSPVLVLTEVVVSGTHCTLTTYGSFLLPNTDSGPNPGTHIRPKNEYSGNRGSESR